MERTGATHSERRALAECGGWASGLHVFDGSAAISLHPRSAVTVEPVKPTWGSGGQDASKVYSTSDAL
jgi:hypothetical protein